MAAYVNAGPTSPLGNCQATLVEHQLLSLLPQVGTPICYGLIGYGLAKWRILLFEDGSKNIQSTIMLLL